MSLKFLDIEYLIRKDNKNEDRCILSVQSRANNCSTHMRYPNSALKVHGLDGLFEVFEAMEKNLIFQTENDLLLKV